jgi:hypothetical protein
MTPALALLYVELSCYLEVKRSHAQVLRARELGDTAELLLRGINRRFRGLEVYIPSYRAPSINRR